jgi:hypothetical protein
MLSFLKKHCYINTTHIFNIKLIYDTCKQCVKKTLVTCELTPINLVGFIALLSMQYGDVIKDNI